MTEQAPQQPEHQETGHRETGHQETGHQETGHQETGHQETGHQQPGFEESGRPQTGHHMPPPHQSGYQAAPLPTGPATYRRLTRTSWDAPISGVCGGLARYFGVDPTLVRVLAVIAAVLTFPAALIAYVVMWAVIPKE